MPELKDVFELRTKAIDVLGKDGEPVFKVWISPDAFNRKVLADIQVASESKDAFAVAETIIVPLVNKWDLTMNGKPYAITADNVAALGLPLEQAVVEAINGVLDFLAPKTVPPLEDSADG